MQESFDQLEDICNQLNVKFGQIPNKWYKADPVAVAKRGGARSRFPLEKDDQDI